MAGLGGAIGNIVRVTFQAVTEPFVSGAKVVSRTLLNIQNDGVKTGKTLRSTMDDLHASTRRAQSGLEGIKSILGALFTLYAGKKLFDFTLGQAADFEYYELQYKILLGGMDKAKARMEELNKFNLFTPFQLEELIKADKLLTSFGIRSPQALKTIGDAAAGAGQSIEDVSFWMGRIAAGDVGFGLMRLSEMSIVTRKQLEDMGLKFEKNNSYAGDFNVLMDKIFEHMQNKYPNAMNDLSATATGMYSNLMDSINLFGREIGFKALDNAKEAMQTLINKIWELKENGTLDQWAQNIGSVIEWLINWILYVIEHIDEIAASIGRMAQWVQQHLSTILFWIQFAIEAWISWKLAVIATNVALYGMIIISTIIGFIRVLIATGSAATAMQWAWNVAMNANPIGIIITLVGMLIFAIIQLVKNWGTAKYYFLIGVNVILVAFFALLEGILWVINKIAEGYNFLYGWIPGIGKITQGIANATGAAFDYMAGRVENAKNKIVEYQNALANAKAEKDDPGLDTSKTPQPSGFKMPEIPGVGPVPKSVGLGSREDEDGGSKKDAVDHLEDKYSNLLKEAENLADEAEKRNNLDGWNKAQASLKDLLGRKLRDLDNLIRNSTGEVAEKARAERAEALKKLAEIDKQLSENTIKFIENDYENKLKIAEDKADIAENNATKNSKLSWRTALYDVINIYRSQLEEVNGIISTASGKLREEAEAKKYDILKKISDITKDIREKINNLVEEFNAPTGMDATSLLQYRQSTMGTKGFTVSGSNFVFQLKEAPKSADQWQEVFELSEQALANFLDNTRRRNGKK